ncbi:argininosuccinate synthase domain-containing protein [Streptomyces sp. NPDC005808]|uniref:argininosuccinate synthase domain-containing protein n=1 Tax=Streptomyces sp. NPDC005808 TaxID=3364734 RepID=UPI0036CC81E1
MCRTCGEEFAGRYVAPAIAAQAVYLGIHPVSSTLSRPLIAQSAVELARTLGAQAVLHAANRSQNTLRRLNGALRLLGYEARTAARTTWSRSPGTTSSPTCQRHRRRERRLHRRGRVPAHHYAVRAG